MEMTMVLGPDSDSEDEDTKLQKTQERQEQNRAWRKRKELERWESCGLEPPPSPSCEREEHRLAARQLESQLVNLLLCTACGGKLVPQVRPDPSIASNLPLPGMAVLQGPHDLWKLF